jgi:cytochrome c biogenesis protein CcmG/thiol:disulfide interchange protein DsbE
MRRVAQLLTVSCVFALMGILVWQWIHTQGSQIPNDVIKADETGVGYPIAPQFTLSRVDTDAKLSLATYRGQVVVLNFWASDCIPCVGESRALVNGAKAFAGDGVQFLGVDEVDVRSYALSFMKRHDMTWPSVADNGEVEGHYGADGTPETYIIDKRGRIIVHDVGPVTTTSLKRGIRQALRT